MRTLHIALLFVPFLPVNAADAFPTVNPAGIAVSIGMPDIATLTSVVGKGRTAVQCLVPNATEAATARTAIQASGLHGFVTVLPWNETKLPHPDRTADLVLVAQAAPAIPATEVQRILAPLGTLYRLEGKRWTATAKAWNPQLGEVLSPVNRNSTRHFYPDNTLRGPFSLTWLGGPTWGERIAGGPFASISSQGVYVLGTSVSMLAKTLKGSRVVNTQERYLVARNAFNGVALWERPLESAGGVGSNATTIFIQQKNQVLALDLHTGEQRYAIDTPNADMLICNGSFLGVTGKRILNVYSADTGKFLWKHEGMAKGAGALGPCDVNTFFIQGAQGFLALNAQDGAVRWQRNGEDISGKDWAGFACLDSGILGMQGKEFFYALDPKTGATKWKQPFTITGGNVLLKRLLIRHKDGVVYLDKMGYRATDGTLVETLETTADHACCPTMTTLNIGVDSRMKIFDFSGKTLFTAGATRMPCGGHSMIANGLFYGLPNECECSGGQIQAIAAFGNSPSAFDDALFAKPLLVTTGPAAGAKSAGSPATDGWPEFGGNGARDFAYPGTAPKALKPLWKTALFAGPRQGPITASWRASSQTGLTPPVVAGDLVVCADIEGNMVHGLDAKTGAVRWSYTANAAVSVPSTLIDGRCLFGAHDGSVTCLDAATGKMQWQVRLAPDDRRMLAFGQWESAWPVVSGVSVVNGTAHAVAGRTAMVHGGLVAAALKLDTGAVQWNRRISDTWQGDTTGGVSYLLQHDGTQVYRGGSSLGPDPKKVTWPRQPFLRFPRSGALSDIPALKAFDSWRAQFVPINYADRFRGRALAKDANGILLVGAVQIVGQNRDAVDSHSIALYATPTGKQEKNQQDTPLWEVQQPAGRGFQAAILTSNAAIAMLSHIEDGKQETASEIIILDRSNGKVLNNVVIPEVASHAGLAISGGRLIVTCRSGQVYGFGSP